MACFLYGPTGFFTHVSLQGLRLDGSSALRSVCSAAGVSSGCGATTRRAATMRATSAALCTPTRAASSCSCPRMWSPRTGTEDQCSPPSSRATSLVSTPLQQHLDAVGMHAPSCKPRAGLLGHQTRGQAARCIFMTRCLCRAS